MVLGRPNCIEELDFGLKGSESDAAGVYFFSM